MAEDEPGGERGKQKARRVLEKVGERRGKGEGTRNTGTEKKGDKSERARASVRDSGREGRAALDPWLYRSHCRDRKQCLEKVSQGQGGSQGTSFSPKGEWD